MAAIALGDAAVGDQKEEQRSSERDPDRRPPDRASKALTVAGGGQRGDQREAGRQIEIAIEAEPHRRRNEIDGQHGGDGEEQQHHRSARAPQPEESEQRYERERQQDVRRGPRLKQLPREQSHRARQRDHHRFDRQRNQPRRARKKRGEVEIVEATERRPAAMKGRRARRKKRRRCDDKSDRGGPCSPRPLFQLAHPRSSFEAALGCTVVDEMRAHQPGRSDEKGLLAEQSREKNRPEQQRFAERGASLGRAS